ncbi:MAG: hypothetical protein IJC46_02085 [Clostridia bacterium]|nr:hypothetical protein [Clostridia bacterium]
MKAEVARPFDDMSNDIIPQQKRNVNYETKKERGANFNQDFTKEVVDRLAAALNPYRLAMNAQIDRQGVQRMEEKIVDELLSDDEFKYTSSEQVAEENGGADFSKTFDNMTPDERQVQNSNIVVTLFQTDTEYIS